MFDFTKLKQGDMISDQFSYLLVDTNHVEEYGVYCTDLTGLSDLIFVSYTDIEEVYECKWTKEY